MIAVVNEKTLRSPVLEGLFDFKMIVLLQGKIKFTNK